MKSLAAEIQAAQGPEIETMTGWLTAWGQAAPTSGGHDMSKMGGTGMDGMMTDEQMQQLSAASGTAFDRRWLQLMVAHHKGAVEMSDVELRDGENTDAKKLAQQIIDAQKQESPSWSSSFPPLPVDTNGGLRPSGPGVSRQEGPGPTSIDLESSADCLATVVATLGS